ncbi:glycosyltransferase family 4 protein [Micromonospora aurantiaca (nom. illeg.)]
MAPTSTASRRVLVVNQYAKPLAEAGGTRHVELFGRLSGWDYTIIAGDLDNYSRTRNYQPDPRFVRVWSPGYSGNNHRRVLNWLGYSMAALLAGLRQPRPDVVYASSPHILAPVAGWLLARLRRARFVLEIRDLWPESMVSTGYLRSGSRTHRLLTALESWLYRRADRIVVVAGGWRGYLRDRGVDPAKVCWVSNSAEPSDFVPRPDRYAPLRDRVPVAGRLVVYAGAHGPANGLDLLLDAAAELPEHTFLLIGDGLDKARLVERARTQGLTNVHFLGTVPKRELAGIIGGADVGVHVLTNAEIFRLGASPNKLYDYLAAGLPVVTNCPDEPTEIVHTTGAGIAVEPADIVPGLRKLLDEDTATLRAMGERGRRYIEDHRSRTVMAARLQRLLDEVRPPVQ